ncbi:fimbria/pilus periplasmic chaperone [Aureimonas altamirensis]|uniref:fimbrial biogenesis chaperone n=1 Tax=Aureimonas altamirensis TaxID=370622 RepID=UPI00203721E6|nr:fimbria/pilus periplasmic chaperone [Aureimonas altamirensis]MCM2503645.1 fimbria/pilus periplasmic chaperone [Aureimonas altamirensis]
MINYLALAAIGAIAAAIALPAHAGSIRVSPTKVEMAGNSASMLRVRNEEKTPVTVQVRVFRSIPAGDGFRLEETRDVVASPPMTTLRPGAENIVRIVHVGGAAAEGRRSYRLLVDEVPDRRRMKPGTVAVVVRHSIPVVFSD